SLSRRDRPAVRELARVRVEREAPRGSRVEDHARLVRHERAIARRASPDRVRRREPEELARREAVGRLEEVTLLAARAELVVYELGRAELGEHRVVEVAVLLLVALAEDRLGRGDRLERADRGRLGVVLP